LSVGVIAVVLGIVGLAGDLLGLGLFAIALGIVFTIWAEKWHRAPNNDD
jgi:hypothetical protein